MRRSQFDKLYKIIMEDLKDSTLVNSGLTLKSDLSNLFEIYTAILSGYTEECIVANKDNTLPNEIIQRYISEIGIIDRRLKPTNNALEFICQRLFELSEFIKDPKLENIQYVFSLEYPDKKDKNKFRFHNTIHSEGLQNFALVYLQCKLENTSINFSGVGIFFDTLNIFNDDYYADIMIDPNGDDDICPKYDTYEDEPDNVKDIDEFLDVICHNMYFPILKAANLIWKNIQNILDSTFPDRLAINSVEELYKTIFYKHEKYNLDEQFYDCNGFWDSYRAQHEPDDYYDDNDREPPNGGEPYYDLEFSPHYWRNKY